MTKSLLPFLNGVPVALPAKNFFECVTALMKAAEQPCSLRLRLSELGRPLLLPGGTIRLAVIPKFFNAFPRFLSKAAVL